VVVTLFLGLSQIAWADTETGGYADGPVDDSASSVTYTDAQTALIDAGEAEVLAVGALLNRAGTGVTDHCIPACPAPTGRADPSPLYWEGEGDGAKTYTCGPAATRDLLSAIGVPDPGEAQIASWEGTSSSSGTGIGMIVTALNDHYGSKGTWKAVAPGTPNNLEARVIEDVNYEHMPVIANVQPGVWLKFWNGHSVQHGHYDLISGYNWDAGTLRWAEEWNTAENSVGTQQYGNPYGFWNDVTAQDGYDAIVNSPSGQAGTGIVWSAPAA
jgi:hypothetical protein